MRSLVALLVLVVAALLAVRFGVAIVDRALNRTRGTPARAVPLPHPPIVDLHTDALLWNRDILERSTRGQVDLPRMTQGGVVLQVFSATNSFPLGANYRRTPDGPDLVALVALANGWPRASWHSPFARALAQAHTLGDAIARSGGRLRLVTSARDIERLRDTGAAAGAILSLEGLHGLDGEVAPVDTLFAAGFRIFGLVHMTDTEVAGSATGWNKGGLTPFGRRVVARIDSLGGIIDLAHASSATIRAVLEMAPRHLMVTHTGVTATCPGNRNLGDEQLRAIARADGIVGIGFWEGAVCGRDPAAIARAIRHAADVMGVERVALGSDFDGAVVTPFDAAGGAALIPALRAERFRAEEIEAILSGNALRFFARALPPG